ncbi:MAG TPA: PIN domain-containing protein [Terracidiphilus sp.]|nr:PIN domain-containing protein [Terracidiphilus sp.]
MASELSLAGKSSRTFLDTNVLAYSDDPRDPAKQQTALNLIKVHLRERTGVVSLQVLQEYFDAATRKLKLNAELAKQRVQVFAKFHVAEPTVIDILAAIDIHRLHSFSFWDALIVLMAKQAGCRVLLSEDMQNGREIDGVKIVNPFL